jgi:hypothetical protein
MKGILEFTLPDEQDEYGAAISGGRCKCRAETLYDSVFRPHLKYEHPLNKPLTARDKKVIQAMWDKVREHFDGAM